MILADTSVWIDHLNHSISHLEMLINTNRILMQSMIIGEIFCGGVPNRYIMMKQLNKLPNITEFRHSVVLSLIEKNKLMARGLGFIDAHIFCFVINTEGATLWTRDLRLNRISLAFNVAYNCDG